MKKLHSFAFCALVTPVLTFGATSVLAQQSTGQDVDRQHQTTQTQRDQGATRSTPGATQSERSTQRDQGDARSTGMMQRDQSAQHDKQSDSQKMADRQKMGEESGKDHRGYMDSVPAQGLQASNLIGAKVSTTADKDVGPVDDLIIDRNGQVVAIVVSVGGFLGMGEKDVAIGWDHVTTSGTADDLKLQIDVSRDKLRDAPEFKKQD